MVVGSVRSVLRLTSMDDGGVAAPAIHARGLAKRFGQVTALDGVDLDVAAGEVVALLGPNGAGKSTLLRVLSTTVLPDHGRACVDGHDVVEDPLGARQALGVALGDERSWYWRLTGRANLEFFAVMYGMRRRDARRRVEELLCEVGLSDAADRRFDGYSAGMRARLSLARAMVASPPVLLLDEPTRSLDPVAASEFRGHVRRLAGDQRRAVLFTTHDLHEAADTASRVLGLVAGRVAVVEDGLADAAALERAIMSVTGDGAAGTEPG